MKAVGQKFPRWRNLAAAVFLLIATTQISWGILDSQGLAQYGASGWPYELNPAANWITAGIFLLPGLWCLSGGPSVSRACALGLALGLGWRFYGKRSPANPYKDYGEDHTATTILYLLGTTLVISTVILLEAEWQKMRAAGNQTTDGQERDDG